MKNKLLLFTISFPYTKAAEGSFIKYELKYLLDNFKHLIIIPENIEGERETIDKRIIVDKSLANFLNSKRAFLRKTFNGIALKYLLVEFFNNPKIVFQPKKMLRLMFYIDKMKQVNKWFKVSQYNKNNNTLIYTYWFTPVTSSFLFYSNKNNVITRVHGGDLYEERHNGYLPLRKLSIKKITAIYCVSQAGINYLNSKYPTYKNKFKLARLGTEQNSKSENINLKGTKIKKKKCRIVSCSGLIPLKRVDLILMGLEFWGQKNEDIMIEWIHFGGGPLFKEILKESEKIQNPKLTSDLKGHVTNDEILEYYQNNFVDLFITTSSTEGGVPVTLQEAQSFGIPSIGTKVGGIPEIINEKTGLLIPENPTPKEIADAIGEIYNKDEKEIEQMRLNCYKNWEKNFNADINFKSFAEEIKDI